MKSVLRALPLAALLVCSLVAYADKKKPTDPTRIVDSGSFGIFIHGRRVATEKFQIAQENGANVTRSELKVDGAGSKADQRAELEMTATGELRRYAWKELSPGKAEATVEPDNQDQFLVEHMVPSPNDKPIEQPFILPPSTAILDDYFFSQRELLAWRYLGSGCTPDANGETQCKLGKVDFGALIPRQRASVLVSMQYMGKEKVMIHGKPMELDRFNLVGDGIDWSLWLDNTHLLQRVVVNTDGTEVVRD